MEKIIKGVILSIDENEKEPEKDLSEITRLEEIAGRSLLFDYLAGLSHRGVIQEYVIDY